MIKKLPFEILQKLFKKLHDEKDIESCMYVCKSWNKAASDLFWSTKLVVLKNTLDSNRFLKLWQHDYAFLQI